MLFKSIILCLISCEIAHGNRHIIRVNSSNSIELKIMGVGHYYEYPDFSFAHQPPLGPLNADTWCLEGVAVLYSGKNFQNYSATHGEKSEFCYQGNLQSINSIRFNGHQNSRLLSLYDEPNFEGTRKAYSGDVADFTPPITGSIHVVGSGVSFTFYTMPAYSGADVCISVGTGDNIYNFVQNLETEWGITRVRSFKFGCYSDRVVQPLK